MDDAELVTVDQRVKYGGDNVTGLCLRESFLLQDLIKQLSALHELHDEEEVLVVFVDVKELDDVGVIDLLQDVDFVLKTNFVFLGKFALCDDFDSDLISCSPRATLAYACEAPLSDDLLDLVVSLDIGRVDAARA